MITTTLLDWFCCKRREEIIEREKRKEKKKHVIKIALLEVHVRVHVLVVDKDRRQCEDILVLHSTGISVELKPFVVKKPRNIKNTPQQKQQQNKKHTFLSCLPNFISVRKTIIIKQQ